MIQFSKNLTSEIFGLSVWYGYKSMAQSCFKDGGGHYRFRIGRYLEYGFGDLEN